MVTRKVSSQAILCIFLLIVAIFTNVKTGYSAIKVSLLAETEMATISGGDCACKDCTTLDTSFTECYHEVMNNDDCNTDYCIMNALTTGNCSLQSGGTCKMVSDYPNCALTQYKRYKPNCISSVDPHTWVTVWVTSICGSSTCSSTEIQAKCDTGSCSGENLQTECAAYGYKCVTNCP